MFNDNNFYTVVPDSPMILSVIPTYNKEKSLINAEVTFADVVN